MHNLHSSSPPLSAKKLALHRLPISPPPTYDGDDDGPASKEKPSGRRQHDPDNADKSSSKKPRHRHSQVQLTALNELFERNEHPSLEDRNELAERLGMEPKTVHAWFQNKRASTKKRNKTSPFQPDQPEKSTKPSTLPSIANLLNATPQPSPPSTRKSRQKDLHLNDHVPAGQTAPQESTLEGSFFAGFSGQEQHLVLSHNRGHHPEFAAVPQLPNSDPDRMLPDSDSRFVSENDALPPRRGRDTARMRTSREQTEELRRAYTLNDHPTPEQRQQLAERIGMRVQSVTNWFQNQRSLAKKRREDSSSVTEVPLRQPPSGGDGLPLAPRSHHPSLAIPERDRPSLPKLLSAGADEYCEGSASRSRMSLPPSLNSRLSSPRTRRGALPYARDSRDLHIDEGRHYDHRSEHPRAEDVLVRPRRSRPERHQLDALKKLLHQTSTPSIEERNALALEVDMEIGKVTNWFRNIRQNARKRGKRPRASTASANRHEQDASSGSSVYDDDDAMDLVCDDTADQEMDDRSEEEYQEAVTPFTDISTSPPPHKRSRSHLPVDDGMSPMDVGLVGSSAFPEFTKVVGMAPVGPNDYDVDMNAVTYSGVKLEDALLLLSFHKHVVH